MARRPELTIDSMLTYDATGYPQAPNLRQLLDKDVQALWIRDKSPNKEQYIKEAGVIYYLADPKSPCNQEGLSTNEAIKRAIENFDLPKDYQPDLLVWSIIKRYSEQRRGIALQGVITLKQSMHNAIAVAKKLSDLLSDQLAQGLSSEEAGVCIGYIDSLNEKVLQFPKMIEALNKAEENLAFEEESIQGRGGISVVSSMIEE